MAQCDIRVAVLTVAAMSEPYRPRMKVRSIVQRTRRLGVGAFTSTLVCLLSVAGGTGATTARAAEVAPQEAPPAELVGRHRYVVSGTYERPGGAGFDYLVGEGAASEFLLLGESHQTAETPRLFEALAVALRSEGYGAIAVELGPLSARDTVDRLRSGGVAAHRESVTRYPFTLPFFELRGEAELLETALQDGYEIWGLDQEFIGSGRYWLDRLAELVPDQTAAQMIARWQERELAGVQHYMETESTDKVILSTATAAELVELRTAFEGARGADAAGGSERAEALAIIDALTASARIYQLWSTANYENNRQRVAYMSANLVTRLEQWQQRAGAPARVLMKFGSYHMGRGRSPANQFDLGNLAMQLATYRGGSSLHVFATALGMRRADGGFADWARDEPVWRIIREQVDPRQPWTVFDLRPLRPYFHLAANQQGNEQLANTVWNYDLVAIAPEFHPAEALVTGQ